MGASSQPEAESCAHVHTRGFRAPASWVRLAAHGPPPQSNSLSRERTRGIRVFCNPEGGCSRLMIIVSIRARRAPGRWRRRCSARCCTCRRSSAVARAASTGARTCTRSAACCSRSWSPSAVWLRGRRRRHPEAPARSGPGAVAVAPGDPAGDRSDRAALPGQGAGESVRPRRRARGGARRCARGRAAAGARSERRAWLERAADRADERAIARRRSCALGPTAASSDLARRAGGPR